MAATPTSATPADPGLHRHTLTTGELLANNISETAPAIATFFVMGGIVAASGVGTPLVVLIAGIGFFLHANVNAEFAKYIPSAGFYATYNARTFGSPFGAVMAGGYLIGMACFYVGVYFQMGVWVSISCNDLFGFDLSWWIPAIVVEAIVTLLLLRGVRISVRTAVGMFTFEILVLIAGGIAMLVKNGSAISGDGFNPANISGGLSGFGLGFPLAIFLLLGATGSSPLAEETRNPRHSVPLAIRIAVPIGILIYVGTSWVEGIGFRNNVGELTKASYPFITAATNALGPLKYVMYLAGFSSALGVMLSTGNAGSRVLFNTAREGLMPATFTRCHSRWRTPWRAILFPNIGLMIITLILGGLVGGANGFDYAVTLATDVLVPIFIITNIALIVYASRHLRDHYSWWNHAVLPAVGIIALGFPLYEAVKPSQAPPYNWYGVLILGAYAISVVYVLLRGKRTGTIGSLLADAEPGSPSEAPG